MLPTEELIRYAGEEDADYYSPKMYYKTKALMQTIMEKIRSDNYNYIEVRKLADSAEEMAEFTVKIIKSIKRVESGDNTWEDLILEKGNE